MTDRSYLFTTVGFNFGSSSQARKSTFEETGCSVVDFQNTGRSKTLKTSDFRAMLTFHLTPILVKVEVLKEVYK